MLYNLNQKTDDRDAEEDLDVAYEAILYIQASILDVLPHGTSRFPFHWT